MTGPITEPKPAAAAPAAPPSPSPAPPPSPAAGGTGTPAGAPPPTPAGDDNPYGEVDAAFTKAGMPDPDKGKATPPDKAKDATPGKNDKGTPPPAPKPDTSKAPIVPKELRAELDRVKGELKTKSDSHAALEAKIAEYERKGKDTTVLTDRLTQMEKDMETLRAENRALKRETSPDFKEKYEKPFNDAADLAMSEIAGLDIFDETGTPVEKADWKKHFAPLWNLYKQSPGAGVAKAKQMFGDSAEIVIGHLRELRKLDFFKEKALESEKAKWKENETAEQATRLKNQEQINDFWTKTNAELSEKVEDYHDAPDADKEFAEARTKALAIFDAQPKTLKERIIKDAHNRQRVAAFPVLKLKLARTLKELEEAKAEIEGLKEKPPGRGTRTGGGGGAPEETLEDLLRKIPQ